MSVDIALIGGIALLGMGLILLTVTSLVFVWSFFVKEWLVSFTAPRPKARPRPAAIEQTQPMEQAA